MDVLLIRHGDPDYPRDNLTEKGRREADALAEHLVGAGITRIYCSPMGRARATVEPAARRLGLPVTILDWLHELNGCYDGKHWCWSLPGAHSLDLPEVPSDANWHQMGPFGAHMQPVRDGLARHFDTLCAQYGYHRDGLRYRVDQPSPETLALFCHGGLILTLLSYLFRWPLPLVYAHLAYDPTGVTRLRWETTDGFAVPRAKTINDLSHLARLAP